MSGSELEDQRRKRCLSDLRSRQQRCSVRVLSTFAKTDIHLCDGPSTIIFKSSAIEGKAKWRLELHLLEKVVYRVARLKNIVEHEYKDIRDSMKNSRLENPYYNRHIQLDHRSMELP